MIKTIFKKFRAYCDNKTNNQQAVLLLEAAVDSIHETDTLFAWAGIVDQLYLDLLRISYDRSASDRLRVASVLVYIGHMINVNEDHNLTASELQFAKHTIIVDLTNIIENRFN